MGTKLSFVNPVPANKIGWHQRSPNAPYSLGDANDIPEVNNVFSQKALAAIPSPLARIHIFETAFEFVTKQANFSGFTVFHKMVSDVIDVWEFLYNYTSHKTSGVSISIKTWDGSNELRRLLDSPVPEHRHISTILGQYLNDSRFNEMNNRFDLLYVDNHLVAGTSPLTGFFTAIDPGTVSKIPVPRSRSGRQYFDGAAVNIADRDPDFVKYLYTVFGDIGFRTKFPVIFKYLDTIHTNQLLWADRSLWNQVYGINNAITKPSPFSLYDRISTETDSDLTICGIPFLTAKTDGAGELKSPLLLDTETAKLPDYIKRVPLIWKDKHTWQGEYNMNLQLGREVIDPVIENRILPGIGMKYPFLHVDDFFEDVILSVPYEADEQRFIIASKDAKQSKSYLLPLKPLFFDMFSPSSLSRMLSSEELADGIRITINIPVVNGQRVQYTKSYVMNPQLEGYGKIESVLFDIAFFPFYRVESTSHEDHYLNSDNRVHFTYNTRTGFATDYKLSFFGRKNEEIPVFAGVYDKTRPAFYMNRVTGADGINSDIYAVIKDFRTIRVQAGSQSNYIIPNFNELRLGSDEFDVAVDFGTTNTHVALAANGAQKKEPKKYSVSNEDIQTVTFSKVQEMAGASMSENFSRDTTSNLFARQSVMHQFVPPVIGAGQDPHFEFPTRTVVASAKNRDIYPIITANVAFFHNKDTKTRDERVASNIKWELSGNNEAQKLTSAYLEQLLMMIKHKIVLNGGDPAKMRLVWFLPLSLDKPSITFFKGEWDRLLGEVFPDKNISTHQITESEAPFYYFQESSAIFGDENTISIDIGGGSTDVSFFMNGNPVFFTSFNFAGNTLWTNGYSGVQATNNLTLHFGELRNDTAMTSGLKNKQKLNQMYNAAVHDIEPGSTVELMNFFFAWDKYINFTKHFQQDEKIRFLFLFHYSAVLFHVYRMCRLRGLEFPRHLCHSGNGSKILHTLDASPAKDALRDYVIAFLQNIDPGYSVHNNFNRLTFNVANNEKEITCNGGIYYLRSNKTTTSDVKKSMFMLTPNRFITVDDVFKMDSIDKTIRKEIVEEVKLFLSVFTGTVTTFNMGFQFSINIDHIKHFLADPKINIFEITPDLEDNIYDALDKGLTRKLTHSGSQQQLTEAPFFFPLVQMIYELSNELYK